MSKIKNFESKKKNLERFTEGCREYNNINMVLFYITLVPLFYVTWVISNLLFLSILWFPILLVITSLSNKAEPKQYVFNQLRSMGDLATFCCGFISNKMGFYTSGDYTKTTFIEDLHYYDSEKTLFK